MEQPEQTPTQKGGEESLGFEESIFVGIPSYRDPGNHKRFIVVSYFYVKNVNTLSKICMKKRKIRSVSLLVFVIS
jgi:hypothetical protein